jgi:hypothetical protein
VVFTVHARGRGGKVAKSGNPNYEKMAQRLYKPYQDQIRRKITLSESVTKRITTELLVNTLSDGLERDAGRRWNGSAVLKRDGPRTPG